MDISKLCFFDKDGYPIDFEVRTDGNTGKPYRYKEIYVKPLSVSLFDCINLFVLEKDSDENYFFPQIGKFVTYNADGTVSREYDESIEVRWAESGIDDNPFFLYNIEKDDHGVPYIKSLERNTTKCPNSKCGSTDIIYDEATGKYKCAVCGAECQYDDGYYILNKDNCILRDENNPKSAKIPYQISVAFSPKDEVIYERDLNIYYIAGKMEYLIYKIHFYGEGIEEDDRFRVHVENFGIKFNRTDALMLKDYDIKEAVPDWEDINGIRKSLVVNKEEIFPYVGTYYGLKNILKVLGYDDVLEVKEYWEDIANDSLYKGKYIITSISDMLDDGEYDNFNVLDTNKSVKRSEYFRKTGYIALCYEFTRPTKEYDENECPIIEKTTEFTSNEIFYKMHKLKDYLQSNFLPVNVQIKDVIGEYIYYISFPKYVWVDSAKITEYSLTREINIDIFPNSNERYMQNLYRFYPIEKYDESATDEFGDPANSYINLPINCINPTRSLNVLPNIDKGAQLSDDNISIYNDMIRDFYTNASEDFRSFREDKDDYPDDYAALINEPLGKSGSKKYFTNKKIGCPIILSMRFNELTMEDLAYARAIDFFNNMEEALDFNERVLPDGSHEIRQKQYKIHSSLDELKYGDFYEIEWNIEYNGYPYDEKEGYRNTKFEYTYRSTVIDAKDLPVFLPYEGYYTVTAVAYDLTGNASKKILKKGIEVKTRTPNIVAGYTGDDKFDFSVANLGNVRIEDFGTSTAVYPVINVLRTDMTNDGVNIQNQLINSAYIQPWINSAQIFNMENERWEEIDDNSVENSRFFGFGKNGAITLDDLSDARICDLFHMRACDTILSRSTLPVFYLSSLSAGSVIYIGSSDSDSRGYSPIVINIEGKKNPTIYEICEWLNNGGDGSEEYIKVLGKFNFSIAYCEQYNSDIIVATAKSFDKSANQYIDVINGENIERQYSFDAPKYGYDYSIKLVEKSDYPDDVSLLSCDIPINDILDGSAHDISYMIDNGYFSVKNGDEYDHKYGEYMELDSTNSVLSRAGLKETIDLDYHRCGTLPILYDENFLNIRTCKFSNSSFRIPRFKYVIFFSDNIDGQIYFKWTLKNTITGKNIFIVRRTPYFVWRFDEVGTYTISYYSEDSSGNDYYNEIEGMITVMDSESFIESNEIELNLRSQNK